MDSVARATSTRSGHSSGSTRGGGSLPVEPILKHSVWRAFKGKHVGIQIEVLAFNGHSVKSRILSGSRQHFTADSPWHVTPEVLRANYELVRQGRYDPPAGRARPVTRPNPTPPPRAASVPEHVEVVADDTLGVHEQANEPEEESVVDATIEPAAAAASPQPNARRMRASEFTDPTEISEIVGLFRANTPVSEISGAYRATNAAIQGLLMAHAPAEYHLQATLRLLARHTEPVRAGAISQFTTVPSREVAGVLALGETRGLLRMQYAPAGGTLVELVDKAAGDTALTVMSRHPRHPRHPRQSKVTSQPASPRAEAPEPVAERQPAADSPPSDSWVAAAKAAARLVGAGQDGDANQRPSYTVRILVMQPVEVDRVIRADSIAGALSEAATLDGVVEVLSVSKTVAGGQ